MPLYKCNRCGKIEERERNEWHYCTNETPMMDAFHGEPISCDDSDEAMEEIESDKKEKAHAMLVSWLNEHQGPDWTVCGTDTGESYIYTAAHKSGNEEHFCRAYCGILAPL